MTISIQRREVMAFTDAVDVANSSKFYIDVALGINIMSHMYTDSLSHFDIMTKATVLSKQNLMIDLSWVKNVYNTDEIDNIFFIRSECNQNTIRQMP